MSPVTCVMPFINRKAIKADYFSANARQLQAVYNYQRVILDAVAEVVNRLSKVQNYQSSIEIKKQAVKSLEAAVDSRHQSFSESPRRHSDRLPGRADRPA